MFLSEFRVIVIDFHRQKHILIFSVRAVGFPDPQKTALSSDLGPPTSVPPPSPEGPLG